MMDYELEYDIGDMVYLKTDKDQCPRIVTAICIRGHGYVQYELTQGATASWHTAIEITSDVDILIKTDN